METYMDRELGWDDVIENDGQQFVTLPEGDYSFKVNTYERARYGGGEKLPPCNKAVLDVTIASPAGSTTIKYNLFLHSKQEWKLCQFFTSIGQRKHGEPLKMNWNTVPGATGRCKVGIHKWTNDKGEERTNNEILEFYEPSEKPGYTPGVF